MRSSSRRAFLRTGALGAAAGLAVACTSPTPRPGAPAAQPPTDAAPATNPPSTPPTTASATNAVQATPVPATTTAQANAAATPMDAQSAGQRALVVVQLSGGHDGLNAVVPYGDGLYYQLRPQINIPADKVLHLDDQVGLHPNLTAFKTLFDQGQLALLQGVGYPNPNR